MNDVDKRTAPADTGEIVLTRVLDAPRALVWRAWTDPAHFTKWFAPPPIAVTDCAIDARVGGRIRFTHAATDGSGLKVRVEGTFVEVVPEQRLVISFGFVDQDGNPATHPLVPDGPLDARALTVVTLADRNGGTELMVRQRIEPAEAAAAPGVRKERELAREGWRLMLDRLDALMAAERGRT